MAVFLAKPHMAEREEVGSLVTHKGTNPIHEGSTLMTYLAPKGPTSEYH